MPFSCTLSRCARLRPTRMSVKPCVSWAGNPAPTHRRLGPMLIASPAVVVMLLTASTGVPVQPLLPSMPTPFAARFPLGFVEELDQETRCMMEDIFELVRLMARAIRLVRSFFDTGHQAVRTRRPDARRHLGRRGPRRRRFRSREPTRRMGGRRSRDLRARSSPRSRNRTRKSGGAARTASGNAKRDLMVDTARQIVSSTGARKIRR